jgi:hypothetical protein
VGIGAIQEGVSNQQLWTEDLVSCLGIAIVGTPTRVPYDKILAHFYASEITLDSDFDKLGEKVSSTGMKDLRAYLSVPDARTETIAEWDNDMAVLSEQVTQIAIEKLTAIVGSAPKVLKRHMKRAKSQGVPWGSMAIDNQRHVLHEGQGV